VNMIPGTSTTNIKRCNTDEMWISGGELMEAGVACVWIW
jgi:hypothetical protein